MTAISPGQIDIFLPNHEKIKERHVKNILKVRLQIFHVKIIRSRISEFGYY
jgi:hypothetical protein